MTETSFGPVAHGHASDPSRADVLTSLLTLTPAFLDALKKVAPKKRRSKVPYVIALALLAVVAVLGADASTREFGLAKGQLIVARLHHAPASSPVSAPVAPVLAQVAPPAALPAIPAEPVVKADEAASTPVVVTAPAAKKSTKTPAASKKPQSRPAGRQAAPRHTAMLAARIPAAKTRDM